MSQDLEIGEEVEVIKNIDDDQFGFNLIGKKGIVDRRVSGGYAIKFRFMVGGLEIVVGSIDWQTYLKRVVTTMPAASSLPPSLKKWYAQTMKTIKS